MTSLITQLLTANTVAKLPFVELINEGRWLGARLSNHENSEFVRFPYEESIHNIHQLQLWPEPTTSESHILLELHYAVRPSITSRIWPTRTLEVELIDYPGEWLADLPMLNQSYFAWSAEIINHLSSFSELEQAQLFLQKLSIIHNKMKLDKNFKMNENDIDFLQATSAYKGWLAAILQRGEPNLLLQPGRFLSPGHLENTPLLNFFPWDLNQFPLKEDDSIISLLKKRYKSYQKKVVSPFITDFFGGCSRQIILLDLVNTVGAGKVEVERLQQLVQEVFKIHEYGTNNWLRRMINPNIEKILVASSKADLLTPDQHRRMQHLLGDLVRGEAGKISTQGCDYKALAISAIRATETRLISEQGKQIQAVCGRVKVDADSSPEWVTVIPGDFPESMSQLAVTTQQCGANLHFLPPENWQLGQQALPHIRMDQVIEFLVGDLMQ